MSIAWWLLVAPLAVLLVTIVPSPIEKESECEPDLEPPVERDNGIVPDDDWLTRLKAACEAGYYKADTEQPCVAPPDDASCRDCFFWLDGVCRLSWTQRQPHAEICGFFHGPTTSGAVQNAHLMPCTMLKGDRRMDDLNTVNREHIEKVAEELDPTPDPGWDKMEQTVREVREHGGESNHPTGQDHTTGTGDQHVVSRSGDLTEPAGTESDSY